MENQADPKVLSLVKAIAFAENGGQPDIKNPKAGQTGEMKSIFQFTPDTWKHYSKQVSGQDLPMTPENEATVTYAKVADWMKKGFTPEQIASMWNAGEHRPDAYKQNWKGMNKKYGVAFDTPAYAKKVTGYYNQFSGGEAPTQNPEQKAIAQSRTGILPQESKTKSKPGLIAPAMKEVRQV